MFRQIGPLFTIPKLHVPSDLLLMASTAKFAAAKNCGFVEIGKRPPILSTVSAEVHDISTRIAGNDTNNMPGVAGG